MKINSVLAFIIVIIIISCNEGTPPDLLSKAPYDINVVGRISSEYGYHYVKITKPIFTGEQKKIKSGDYTSFLSEIVEEPVENAIVSISDGTTVFELKLFTDTGYWKDKVKGFYRTVDKIAGIQGKVYTLKINYSGKEYLASDSLIVCDNFEFKDITQFYTEYQSYYPGQTHVVQNRNLFGFKKSNYWDRIGTDNAAFAKLDFAKLQIASGMDFNLFSHAGLTIQAALMNNSANGNVGWDDDMLLIFSKHSISEKYYNFIFATFSETEWKSSIFAGIPGKIPTNLSEGGVGFFHATDVKRKSISGKEFTDLILKNN